jgi:GNAT superfamily N-acetyltransferase
VKDKKATKRSTTAATLTPCSASRPAYPCSRFHAVFAWPCDPGATPAPSPAAEARARAHSGTRAEVSGFTGDFWPLGESNRVLMLFAAERWQTYTDDPERTYRALTAPGATTLVAIDKGVVAGLVQLQSDGEIQAHLSALITGAQWRRRGLGRALVREALARAGGLPINVLSRSGSYYSRSEPSPLRDSDYTRRQWREDRDLLDGRLARLLHRGT